MLARVTGGKAGIVEYLEQGIKSGRELSRDELDERVCIDGNLSITDKVITQLNESGRENNYLHITLSFGEQEISEDEIIEAYEAYKEKVMNAYHDEEFNIYAEIHLPKIKSYKDRKTGDIIERFPHVHIVIPKVNLVTNKALDPYGFYNVESHDSIQEHVNRKCSLESPYDHQRKYRIVKDDAEFISRYKGDTFKGSRAEFKNELFELINNKDIRSMKAFEHELSHYGEVSTGKLGASDEYLKIKLPGESKNIRLKETCFQPAYIVDRQLLRPKPTDKQIDKLVNEWVDTRSHEMKHIHPKSPKLRKEYYSLERQQREEFLHERRTDYNKQHHLGARRRSPNRKLGTERVGLKRFTEIRNGLPGMPQRGLVRTAGERPAVSKGVLPSDANHHLESSRTSRDHQLRRVVDRRGGDGRGRRVSGGVSHGLPKPDGQLTHSLHQEPANAPRSLSEQFLSDHIKTRTSQHELEHFRQLRKTLDPERVLQQFEKTHGLVRDNYTTFKAKDGSARIKIGTRAFNVSDFCTQHMHQSWTDTKALLSTAYQEQRSDQDESKVINSISFVSRYVTQGYTSEAKLSRLDESIMILKYLQQQEKYGDNTMSLAELEKYRVKSDLLENNSISNAEISLRDIADNFKRQQALAKQLSLKMSDLVAIKDIKNNRVDFSDRNTGDKIFKDVGNKLIMSKRKPEHDHVAAAMTLAAEKFGAVKITGTKEFKQQVIDVAIAKNLNIVFDSPKMQALFMKNKEEHAQQVKVETIAKDAQIIEKSPTVSIVGKENSDTQSGIPSPLNQKESAKPTMDEAPTVSSPGADEAVTLVKHGSAPYLHNKENTNSYYVTLSNGETQWGKGLKEAIEESGAKVGDEISVQKMGSKDVKVDVDIKDDNGKKIGSEELDTQRNDWTVSVIKPVQEHEPESIAKDEPVNNDLDSATHLTKPTVNQTLDLFNDQLLASTDKAETFEVKYQWIKSENKMQVTVNDEAPEHIPEVILDKIIARDNFLKNYSRSMVQSGLLVLSAANGNQPIPKVFNAEGETVKAQELTQSATKLKL